MARKAEFSRYTLYGEESADVAPEFVHLERIFDRSSLYEWTIEPHAHPHMLQVLLLETGDAVLASDGASEVLAGPGVIVVPAGCVHAFRFSTGAEGWVLSLAADLLHDPRLAGLVADLGVIRGEARRVPLDGAAEQAARLRWLLDDLARRLAQGGAPGAALLAQVGLVLATVAELAAQGEGEGRRDPRAALVSRFRALVEAHYREHWAVAAYAAALGTTASTLTRACRALTGKAPADIAHDRLMLEAMRYLAFTGAAIAQISDKLGFSDPAYFARFFKSRTGRTASHVRTERSWRGVDQDGLAETAARSTRNP